MSRKYPVRYFIEPGGEWLKEETDTSKWGLCDALGIVSVILPEDGSRSVAFAGTNADGTPMSDADWFKNWAMLAYSLSESKTLGPGRKEFCRMVHEHVREIVASVRRKEEGHR